MRSVMVRKVSIGEGIPKICVSITEESREGILEKGRKIVESGANLAEWRVDWFNYDSFNDIHRVLGELRMVLEEMPLIFTFRNENEGGKKTLNLSEYMQLLAEVIVSRKADIVDVEAFKEGLLDTDYMDRLVVFAKEHGVKVLASNHDFGQTPSEETMFSTLRAMTRLKVDFAKIAVMPENMQDVLSLLSASEMFGAWEESIPFIAISMGEIGRVSRYCGEKMGLAITFGALGEESGPGQIQVEELKRLLMEHHTM